MVIKTVKKTGRKRALLTSPFITFIILIYNCSETPLAPAENSWTYLGAFPSEVTQINALTVWRDVYAAGRADNKGIIILFKNRRFDIVYVSNDSYNYAELGGLAFTGNGYGWACGGKSNRGVVNPLLLCYDPRNGRWEEVPVNGYNGYVVSWVKPIGEAHGWLLLDDSYYSGDRDGRLAKFEQGVITLCEIFTEVTAVYAEGRGVKPTLYAVEFAGSEGSGDYGYPPGHDARVFITDDEGASWIEEKIPCDVVPGLTLRNAEAACSDGRYLYITAEFYEGACGVIRRAGAAGTGEYEVIFLAYPGPYFQKFTALTFRRWDNKPHGISADGVGVGPLTAVTFDFPNVYLEMLNYPLEFIDSEPAGGNGFYGAAKNVTFGDYELLYHP